MKGILGRKLGMTQVFTADGDILYRSDVKDGEGDLYLYTGKSKLIDDDVTDYTSGYYCNSAAAGW